MTGAKEAREPVRASSEKPTGQSPAVRRKRILLVEDSDHDRDVYGGLLWYNGYEVLHAPDGESGVSMALETLPDLILLDVRLPGINGIDVAKLLHAQGMVAPIILLSAVSLDELGAQAGEAEAAAYLQKPIDPFTVVREVMRRVGPSQNPAQ